MPVVIFNVMHLILIFFVFQKLLWRGLNTCSLSYEYAGVLLAMAPLILYRKVVIVLGVPIIVYELSKTKIYVFSSNVEYWIHKMRKTIYRLFVNAKCRIASYMFSSQIVSWSKSAVKFIPSICFAVKHLVSHKQTQTPVPT